MDINNIERYKEEVLNMRIPHDVNRRIEELAIENHTSKSGVARYLLKCALENIDKK